MNWIHQYVSWISWPSVVLMAGVHGNEHSGIVALQRLIDEKFTLLKWKLTIVFANLAAIEQNIRFVDVNMNRCFGKQLWTTKEEERIQDILSYFHEADILLDLHNTIQLSSSPFLITEHKEYVSVFDCEYVVSGLDKLHPWWSDGYMNSLWKIGLCLECGSISDDKDQTSDYAYRMVVNFLRYLNMIEWPSISYLPAQLIMTDTIYISKYEEFTLTKEFGEFEFCRKDQIIGYDWLNVVAAPYDGYIVFARSTKNKWTECFVYCK